MVYLCEVGGLHEGGGVVAVYASEISAYAWLVFERGRALAAADAMEKIRAEGIAQLDHDSGPWCVTEIAQNDSGHLGFEDPIDYWQVREMEVEP